MQTNEVEKVVKLALIRIGIKCDLVGFSYLSKSIELVIATPSKLYNLSKLFDEVALIYHVKNPFRVEANIQNAITQTFNTKGLQAVNDLYGMKIFDEKYKPTTAEMINLIVEYYNLGLYKQVETNLSKIVK